MSKLVSYDNFVNDLYELFCSELLPVVNKIVNDKDFSIQQNVEKILCERYFRNFPYELELAGSSIKLAWNALSIRVSSCLAAQETKYTSNVDTVRKINHMIYSLLISRIMIPNTPSISSLGFGHDDNLLYKEEKTYDDYLVLAQRKSDYLPFACTTVGIEDSIDDISSLYRNYMILSKSGAGVGTNFSRLRPKGEKVKKYGSSSGAISFISIANNILGVIKQGGQLRRGAGMCILGYADFDRDFYNKEVSLHPEIVDFIKLKQDNDGISKISNMNISIAINNTNDLVDKIENKKDIDLSFRGKKYGAINSRDLISMISESIHKSGDPGLLFLDKVNNENIFVDNYPIYETNPCGEEPLFADAKEGMIGCCNLGSIDLFKLNLFKSSDDAKDKLEKLLSKYLGFKISMKIDNNKYNFDFCLFMVCIIIGNIILDLTCDAGIGVIEGIDKTLHMFRNVGLGISGVAGTFLINKIRYGSNESLDLISNICGTLELVSTLTSLITGSFKGPYELAKNRNIKREQKTTSAFITESINDSFNNAKDNVPFLLPSISYIFNINPSELIEKIHFSKRNYTCTTIAPTGSTGMIMFTQKYGDTGQGIEPLFALRYVRSVVNKDGKFESTDFSLNQLLIESLSKLSNKEDREKLLKVVQEKGSLVSNLNSVELSNLNDINQFNYFVTSHDLKYTDHIDIVDTAQRYISSGISKTINVEEKTTVDEITNILLYAMKKKYMKGITIYRDGSLQYQILNKSDKASDKKDEHKLALVVNENLYNVPNTTVKLSTKVRFPDSGKIIVDIAFNENKIPVELFISESKHFEDKREFHEAIGRIVSIALRSGTSIENIIKQLYKVKNSKGGRSLWCGILASTIKELINIAKNKNLFRSTSDLAGITADLEYGVYIKTDAKGNKVYLCPSCNSEMIKQEGCMTCSICGYSKCS